jgi:hypothetical protein
VFASEVAALNFIRTRIARGTEVYADEAGAWNELHGRFHDASDQPSGSLQPRQRRLYRTTPNRSSRACAAPRSAITTILPARICSDTRKRRHGGRIAGGYQTASSSTGSPGSPCGQSRALISPATGSGTFAQPTSLGFSCVGRTFCRILQAGEALIFVPFPKLCVFPTPIAIKHQSN